MIGPLGIGDVFSVPRLLAGMGLSSAGINRPKGSRSAKQNSATHPVVFYDEESAGQCCEPFLRLDSHDDCALIRSDAR